MLTCLLPRLALLANILVFLLKFKLSNNPLFNQLKVFDSFVKGVSNVVDKALKDATRGADEGMDDAAKGTIEIVKDVAGSADVASSSKDPSDGVQAANNKTSDAN